MSRNARKIGPAGRNRPPPRQKGQPDLSRHQRLVRQQTAARRGQHRRDSQPRHHPPASHRAGAGVRATGQTPVRIRSHRTAQPATGRAAPGPLRTRRPAQNAPPRTAARSPAGARNIPAPDNSRTPAASAALIGSPATPGRFSTELAAKAIMVGRVSRVSKARRKPQPAPQTPRRKSTAGSWGFFLAPIPPPKAPEPEARQRAGRGKGSGPARASDRSSAKAEGALRKPGPFQTVPNGDG
jgi:hypothetical protein